MKRMILPAAAAEMVHRCEHGVANISQAGHLGARNLRASILSTECHHYTHCDTLGNAWRSWKASLICRTKPQIRKNSEVNKEQNWLRRWPTTPSLFYSCLETHLFYKCFPQYNVSASLPGIAATNYTVSQKKQHTKLLPITSPNINRFSKFFHCETQWEICNKVIYKYPTNYCWHVAYKECCNLVDRKRQEFAMEGSAQYRAIPKGRGFFVYAYDSQLYRQVKKVGRVRYLKCTIEHCDGSAKLDNVWSRSVWNTPIYTTSQSQTW